MLLSAVYSVSLWTGAAVHAVAPRYVSFLAFCAANVLIDMETLYFLLTNQ
jgi:hypothetical protein